MGHPGGTTISDVREKGIIDFPTTELRRGRKNQSNYET
jgi:hypothetical protein